MKTRHNTTVREAGERWLEASELNAHTQAACQQTLLQYVLKHNLWDITLAELNQQVLSINPVESLGVFLSSDALPSFHDLKEIPIEAWEEYEYQHVIIPQSILDQYAPPPLSVAQQDAMEIAVEEFYGVRPPFYLGYSGTTTQHGMLLHIDPK